MADARPTSVAAVAPPVVPRAGQTAASALTGLRAAGVMSAPVSDAGSTSAPSAHQPRTNRIKSHGNRQCEHKILFRFGWARNATSHRPAKERARRRMSFPHHLAVPGAEPFPLASNAADGNHFGFL
jgi:hypothetical protein